MAKLKSSTWIAANAIPKLTGQSNTIKPDRSNTRLNAAYLPTLLRDATRAQAGATPSAPAAPPPDPRDASYWTQIAGNRQARANGRADLDRADKDSELDKGNAIDQLVQANARSLMTAKQGQNKAGLFYSTTANNQNRDLENEHTRKVGDVNEQFRRAALDRESKRRDLDALYGDGTDDNVGSAGLAALTEAIARALAAQAA